ncbi:MAG: hypothetical protein ACOY0T_40495 [Myxococcota bacterium]
MWIRAAHAEPQDAEAKRVGGGAMTQDYMSGKFAAAQQKLEKAIKICKQGKCSGKVLARLYRDLGVVYLGGLNKPKQGKEALARAVQADPSIQLEADLMTPEIAAAFKEVGGEQRGKKSKPEPADKPEKSEPQRKAEPERDADGAEKIELEEEPEASKPEAVAPAEETADDGSAHKNWFSLGVQQDFLLHKETSKVCFGQDYTCYGPGGVEYTGNIDEGAGNQASGGFGLATTRILLGYDRLLTDKILAGARLGLAFGGAPAGSAAGKFLPLHVELRGAYFFGTQPFVQTGFRPYAGIAAGVAEVDGHIAVDYFDNGNRSVLDAWRKTGKMFAAINLGTQFALTKTSAINAEARVMFMLGTSAIAPALSIGYVHGL